jgi:hypothetical protein
VAEVSWSLSLSALAMFLLVYTPSLHAGARLETSTELVAFVLAFALLALVGWHVPGSLVGKMGGGLPAHAAALDLVRRAGRPGVAAAPA